MTTLRQFCLHRKQALADERQSFETQWQEIAQFISPRSLRWITDSPTQRGGKAHQKIIDPTASLAARNYVSGMMSMVTNPSRQWQKYITRAPKFAKNVAVKQYLAECEDVDRNLLLQSNFYTEAAKLYKACALFGTAAMLIEEDDDAYFRCETFSTGTYYLGKSGSNKINEFIRVYSDTAKNILDQFGEENCSEILVTQANNPKTSSNRFDVLHYIGPNTKYDGMKLFDPTSRKFRSVYIEVGASEANYNRDMYSSYPHYMEDRVLAESGYDEFPIMAVRWDCDGQDIWGSDYPGVLALGEVKDLQHTRKLMAQGLELQMKPAMQAPHSARGSQIQVLPGFTNHVDQNNGGIRPLYETRPDLQSGSAYSADIRQQIQKIFFNDLFLMLSDNRRSGTKAREIEELAQERMSMLSPVLERFSDEFLDPASNRIFGIVERAGRHPVPPPEFQGQDFAVEYISVLATTLKMQNIAAIDRLVAFGGQVGAARPEVLDNFNPDRLFHVYAESTNADPRVLATEEEVATMREQRRMAAAAQQMQASQQMAVEQAKVLSDTKTNEDNALTQLMNAASGGST